MFFLTITGNVKRCQYFNFETNFLKNKKKKTKQEYRFLVGSTNIENATIPYIILPCQKSVLRQIEWGVQNGPITKNEVLLVITLIF